MKNKISTLLFFSLLFANPLFSQHWEVSQMSPMPERVSNNAVVEGIVDGVPYVYSFGGIDSTKLYSGIHLNSFRYNTVSDTWQNIAPLPDTLGKIAAGASRIDDIIYIIGGYHVFSDQHEISSDRVHRYDTQTNTYLTDGAPIPVPIDDQVQAVWRDSLIYVITGWSNTGNVPDVQIYNPAQDNWSAGTPVPTNPFFRAFGASGTIIGDKIYYFGGAWDAGAFTILKYLRIGEINPTNPTEIEWSNSVIDLSVEGYRMAATNVGDRIYWLGGSGVTYNFDGIGYASGLGVEPLDRSLYYDPVTTDWAADFSNDLPMDLRGIANVNDTIQYIAGGMVSGQSVTDQTLKLEWQSFPVSIKTPTQPSIDVTIYPNPTSNKIQIELAKWDGKEIDFRIFDNKGRLQIEKRLTQKESSLDVEHLSEGIYHIELANEKGVLAAQKLVMEK